MCKGKNILQHEKTKEHRFHPPGRKCFRTAKSVLLNQSIQSVSFIRYKHLPLVKHKVHLLPDEFQS
ncbi:hypothetical protein ABHZ32_20465, partial [Bacteroides uniformis]